MTINPTLPVQQQPVIGNDGRMTLPWYRYFHDQNQASAGFVTIPAGTILGNSGASSSYPGPLTIGTGLLLSNGVLSSTVTGGSVTSVGLAVSSPFTVTNTPITTSGTISLNVSPQPANEVWAGPTSGASAIPTFRPLVAADIPPLPYVTSVGLSAPSIFSVSGSPVTSSGTLTFSLNTQASNLVWAGPSSGSAATPSFRSLVAADIPSLPYISSTSTQNANTFLSGPSSGAAASPTFRTMVIADLPSIASQTLLGNPASTSGTPTTITIGANLNLSTSGVLSATGSGGGGVTSVGLSLPSQFVVSGSPVTGSGTLTGAWNNQSSNLVLAGPSSGSATTPTFRSLVNADIPQNLSINSITTSSSSTIGNASSQTNISVNGINSGTAGGSFVVTRLNGSACTAIGNKSAITGGTYDSTPTLFYVGTLNFLYNGTTTTATLDSVGNLSVGTGSGQITSTVNGGNSGNAGGAYNIVRLNGSACIAIGNKSALNGIAYDSTPCLYYNGTLNFLSGATSVATIDSSGNISGQGISGTTGTFSGDVQSGNVSLSSSGGISQLHTSDTGGLYLTASTSSGIVIIRGNNSTNTGVKVLANIFEPEVDNAVACGGTSNRWTAVYAVNGTIQTSDAREKTVISRLTEAEIRAANRILDTIGIYLWMKDVEEKGEEAKHHIGVIAQQVCSIFDEEDLDWRKYGMITYEDDRYGINYAQLNVFLNAGLHSRLKRLESAMGL